MTRILPHKQGKVNLSAPEIKNSFNNKAFLDKTADSRMYASS